MIDQDQLVGDSVHIGHIVGGINSPDPHPFNTNNTGVTSASSVVYEVWLKPSETNAVPVNQPTSFEVVVSPNPARTSVNFEFSLPYKGEMEVFITDPTGRIIDETYFEKCSSGKRQYKLDPEVYLSGAYTFHFLFDARYVQSKRVIIQID
jgi:hypothetical protein